MSDWNTQVIEKFRANGGNVDGMYENVPLLLLTTTGRKSGELRTMPLAYQSDGDRIIIVASHLGAPKHPDWYHNLLAHPQVTVEIGNETFDAISSVVDDSEREHMLELWPMVVDHQAKTTRQIPFVALQRMK